MWTAQTYLGAHVPGAKYFIYLLFEDYVPQQNDFQKTVIENLRKLGIRTGRDAAIFVPDDCAKDIIQEELVEVFRREMMQKISRKTPGLLFTDKNLSILDPAKDRWVYLSLEPYMQDQASKKLPQFFKRMEETIENSKDLLTEIAGPKWRSIWDIMKDTIMLEPNFYGFGVDLTAARSRFLVTENIN